ncbi:MAG TPA: serine/threonine-protein kinase [Polyangiaceae bacterium]
MSDPTPDSAAADPYLGTVLAGRYRVTKALGAGGMGTVYRAEHVHMKKAVAVKILHKHMTAMPEVVARFEREAVAAGRIEHANVAGATDFGRLDDGSFYLVLEYIEGRSLSSLLGAGGSLPALRALVITRQIADGLAAAHAAGIIHRDLKPENVMLLERDGVPDYVKVLDFGIAKVPVEEAEGQKLTQIGTIFGTPQYMSPEQGQGHTVDARADLYALGVMLYEMLAGKLPFSADDLVVLITRHITEPPPPLPDGIHPAVRDLVFELLEKDPANRVQTAAELVERIDRLFKDPAIAPPGSLPPPALLSSAAGHLAHAKTALGVGSGRLDARLLAARAKRIVRLDLPVLARNVHRALLRPVRIGGQTIPRYAIAAALAIALLPPLLMFLARDGGEGTTSGPDAASSASPAGAAADSPDERRRKLVDRAFSGERAALVELEAVPSRERRAADWRALARGQCALGDSTACAAAYKAAVFGAPTLKKDPVVLADVRRLAENTTVYEDAMRLAAHHLDAAGVDILFDVWTSTRANKDSQALNRRARQFLDDGSVRDHASRELRVALDLERAEKKRRCKDVPELVKKAAEYGDERAVPVLDRFAVGRGCGLLGLGDCWGCLRGNKDLAEARAAAAKRPGPAFDSQ